jgi:flagellum-specific ATP synthase
VLVEGDDLTEPVSDTVRSIVDGHIVLSRDLAARGHYPAVDILRSVSRVMNDIVDEKHLSAARSIQSMTAVYEEARDLINIGAYVAGNNPEIDNAIGHIDSINLFLKQDINEKAAIEQVVAQMGAIIDIKHAGNA